MPATAQALEALHLALQQERSLMAEFSALLQEESNILQEGAQAAALTALTVRKQSRASILQNAADQRNALLVRLGYAIDKAGLRACSADHPALAESISGLLDEADRASTQNRGNGRIIQRFMQHNQAALDALQHVQGRSGLYDAHGRMGRPR